MSLGLTLASLGVVLFAFGLALGGAVLAGVGTTLVLGALMSDEDADAGPPSL